MQHICLILYESIVFTDVGGETIYTNSNFQRLEFAFILS